MKRKHGHGDLCFLCPSGCPWGPKGGWAGSGHCMALSLQKGETWAMANCSQATCEGNHIISLHPRPCPPPVMPTCANGYPAVMVEDEDGCCPQFQCQCELGHGSPGVAGSRATLTNCPHRRLQRLGRPALHHLRRHLLHLPGQLHVRAGAADRASVRALPGPHQQLLLRC